MTEHVEDRLSARIHGELDANAARAVDGHVASCAACAARLAELRRVDAALSDLEVVAAPGALWAAIAAETGSRKPAPRRVRRRAAWTAAAALAVAALIALWMRPEPPRARIALDPYVVQAEAAAGAPANLAAEPAQFEAVPNAEALRAAGMATAARSTPLPAFELWKGAARRYADGEVSQLVYHGDGGVFSVFVAPHSAELDFGERRRWRVKMGEWECTQVESDGLAIYWSVSSERQSVLVARADAPLDVAAVLSFFVYGQWESGS